MKYLFTMANKTFAFTLILLFVSGFSQAQKNTDSPYSRYGIGTLSTAGFNGNFGLGGAGIAWRPFQYKPLIYDSLSRSNANIRDRGSNFINIVNPASMSNISLTTFEFSAVSRSAQYTSNGQSRTGSHTQFGHMSLGIPLGEKAGFAVGIKPFSFVGYDYANRTIIEDDGEGEAVNYVYEGSGGVNEIFLGVGYQFLKNFSVGATGSYYFGQLVDDRRVVYDDQSSGLMNSLDERKIIVNSLGYKLGVQYFKHLNDDYRFVAGAAISPVEELNAERTRIFRNYTGEAGTENFRDTALFEGNRKITVATAAVVGIGVAFEKKTKWMLTADLKMNNWGDGSEQLSSGIEAGNGQSINIGFDKYSNTSTFGSYLGKVGYRAGVRYNTSIIRIENEDVTEFGISFGLSLPLRKNFSTLNFGAEVGQRGKDEGGLTKENFFNLQVGVTINDKWFIKRQYD